MEIVTRVVAIWFCRIHLHRKGNIFYVSKENRLKYL